MSYSTKQDVLQDCTVEGNVVKLPNEQLDRKLYEEVSKALQKIGGKWKGGKVAGFVFSMDPTDLLSDIAGGKNRDIKKEFQFFETPDYLADELVWLAHIEHDSKVLEPSAGRGAIVRAINRKIPGKKVDCFELMPQNQDILKSIETVNLIGDDFLKSDGLKYDRIVANPPFSKNQDIDHVMKMYEFLNHGGILISVMSKHFITSNDKKSNAFRVFYSDVEARHKEINAGTFKSSGTMIETIVITIRKY